MEAMIARSHFEQYLKRVYAIHKCQQPSNTIECVFVCVADEHSWTKARRKDNKYYNKYVYITTTPQKHGRCYLCVRCVTLFWCFTMNYNINVCDRMYNIKYINTNWSYLWKIQWCSWCVCCLMMVLMCVKNISIHIKYMTAFIFR